MSGFSWTRFVAVLAKEFVQMRRDRVTFAMMVGVPIMQLVLFGFAINSDPKNLPTAVLDADPSVFSRSFIRAMENSGYFRVTKVVSSDVEGGRLLETGQVQFLVTVPQDFSRKLQRGERPVLLVEGDASDPAATSNALTALLNLNQTALDHDLRGALANLKNGPPPFELRVQRRYNPEGITQYNIVPGLIGVVLTMTMVIMTSLSVTRERERGTMENLLATPVRPIEVMAGKILPFIIVGYIQVTIILAAAQFLFDVPMVGSLALLSARERALHRRQPRRSGSPSRPSRGTSCRRCRWRSSSSCRRSCCRASCSRSAACPGGRSGSARSCRSRTSCGSCAGSC